MNTAIIQKPQGWQSASLLFLLLLVPSSQASSANRIAAESSRDNGGFALATAFPYQGRLQESGQPAIGSYDISFELYDQEDGGTYLGRVDQFDVAVHRGTFSTDLDFGTNVFDGQRFVGGAYVQIEVRKADATGPYTELAPRQRLAGVGSLCTINSDVQVNGLLTAAAPGSGDNVVTKCCNDLEDGGQLEIASFLGSLRADNNELQKYSLGMPTGNLQINPAGGNVGFGVSTTNAPLSLPDGPDVKPGSGGALLIGSVTGPNIALDNNEIMARNNGAVSTLALNFDGGDVRIGGASGGNLDLGVEQVVVTLDSFNVTAQCPAGLHIISGGCTSQTAPSVAARTLIASHPNSAGTAWTCGFQGANPFNKSYAVCGRIQWP